MDDIVFLFAGIANVSWADDAQVDIFAALKLWIVIDTLCRCPDVAISAL